MAALLTPIITATVEKAVNVGMLLVNKKNLGKMILGLIKLSKGFLLWRKCYTRLKPWNRHRTKQSNI